MTMSDGALTKYFDLVPGKWRINASLPGYKVVGCALEGLRHRPFPLRRVEPSEFAERVPFDENGEPMEPPVVLRGMPTWHYYYGNTVYIYPPPLHAWRLMLTYEPREKPVPATPWASSPARPNRTYSEPAFEVAR
jgi:hypothetical protein